MTVTAKDLTSSVLLRLFDQLDEEPHELTVEVMAQSFQPPVHEVSLRTALSLLCQAGLVQPRVLHGVSRYSITDHGIVAVRRHFTMDDNPRGRTFTESADRFDVMTYLNKPKPVDWTRLGTILTGVGIIVAVILAIAF